MSLSICLLSVCLSTHITRKSHGRTSPNFCACCLWLLCSSTDGFAIRYVLPVFWMMSMFIRYGANDHKQTRRSDVKFRRNMSGVGRPTSCTSDYLVTFIRMRHPGWKLLSTVDSCNTVTQKCVAPYGTLEKFLFINAYRISHPFWLFWGYK